MHVLTTRPYGAIASMDTIREYIRNDVTIYLGYGGCACLGEVKAHHGGELVITGEGRDAYIVERISGHHDDFHRASMLDWNVVENHYNDNFLFEDKDLAEDYVRFARENQAMRAEQRQHQRRINDMFGDYE